MLEKLFKVFSNDVEVLSEFSRKDPLEIRQVISGVTSLKWTPHPQCRISSVGGYLDLFSSSDAGGTPDGILEDLLIHVR